MTSSFSPEESAQGETEKHGEQRQCEPREGGASAFLRQGGRGHSGERLVQWRGVGVQDAG
jgi:hypothetical protein